MKPVECKQSACAGFYLDSITVYTERSQRTTSNAGGSKAGTRCIGYSNNQLRLHDIPKGRNLPCQNWAIWGRWTPIRMLANRI